MTENEKEFFKANHLILEKLFGEKLNALKDEVFSNDIDKDQRNIKIDAIKMIEGWLKEVKILDNKNNFTDSYK